MCCVVFVALLRCKSDEQLTAAVSFILSLKTATDEIRAVPRI